MKLPGPASFLSNIVLLFLSSASSVAQSPAEDSLFYKIAVNHLISYYHQSSGDQSGLYNGVQYGQFAFSFAGGGQPFFKEDRPGTGSVVYDGVLYENQVLQYDEVQEVLIMQDSSRRIQLLNQRITAFSVFDNNFIRIIKDSTNTVLLRNGFYNLLYNGNISLLKKEEKLIREEVATGELQRFIDIKNHYYIKKNNVYYSFKSKNALLDILKDHKKDIRQYIKKNNLSYRQNRDDLLIKVTAYYDQLTK